MKPILSHTLVLVVGTVLGAVLSLAVRIHQKEQTTRYIGSKSWESRQQQVAERWQLESNAVLQAYSSMQYVPIPRNLDFSTNTWQRLNYWSSFTRSYLQYNSPQFWKPLHGIISLAFPIEDP